jgi:hypothetical protein
MPSPTGTEVFGISIRISPLETAHIKLSAFICPSIALSFLPTVDPPGDVMRRSAPPSLAALFACKDLLSANVVYDLWKRFFNLGVGGSDGAQLTSIPSSKTVGYVRQ